MDYYSESIKVYQGCLNFEEEYLTFLASKYCIAAMSLRFYHYGASLLDRLQVHFVYSIVLKDCH